MVFIQISLKNKEMFPYVLDKDINEVFDDILLSEEKIIKKSYDDGFSIGASQGNPEGYHLGYHRGAEIGAELGFYSGILETYWNDLGTASESTSQKIESLKTLKSIIDNFPHTNVDNVDIVEVLNNIRARFKKVCAQLKINIKYPESDNFSF